MFYNLINSNKLYFKFQTLDSKTMNYWSYTAILIIQIMLFQMGYSFNPCSVVRFQDFYFDLTNLPREETFFYIDSNGKQVLVQFSGCAAKTCSFNNNYNDSNYKSFFSTSIDGKCQPLTVNATIFQNFDYINHNNKKQGIRIKYLPYITRHSQDNVTTTITKYYSILDVRCSEANAQQSRCQKLPTVKTVNNNVTVIQETLTCSLNQPIGCPQISINNFWQFLMDFKVLFSIILWVIALFQLFFGYFVIRITIFVYGIMSGAVIGIIFSAQNYENFFYDYTGNGIRIFIVILSVVMGILYGITLLTLPKLGYMNIGLWVAIIFSLLMQNSLLYQTGAMLAFYITLGITGVLMMAISLLGFRKFIIVSTAFTSAFCLIRTLGFILPYYPNEFASEKLFAINQATPWQFYLYLLAIIILAILGATFQFCWYKKKGVDHGNKGYYLQNDDTLKTKVKNLLQFNGIKEAIKKGKDEVMLLKNLVVQQSDQDQVYQDRKKPQKKKVKQQIQMKSFNKKQQKYVTPNPVSPINISTNSVKSQLYTKKPLQQQDESEFDLPSEDDQSQISIKKKVTVAKASNKNR